MQVHTITTEERNRMTDQAAHLFVARHVKDYFPCPANSQKICDFIISQVGEDYPYFWPIEFFENAFAYISEHGWFYVRPEEVETEDPAVTRERLAQERVRTEHAARVAADKIARDRAMPLSDLRNVVGVQNKDFREQREQNLLPVRSTGMESRHVEQVKLGITAQARVNVGNANPGLNPNSAQFTKKYAEELSKLRSE